VAQRVSLDLALALFRAVLLLAAAAVSVVSLEVMVSVVSAPLPCCFGAVVDCAVKIVDDAWVVGALTMSVGVLVLVS